jgi:hypothetical protein
MAEGMSESQEEEVIVDGVTYVRLHYPSSQVFGDPSAFLDQLDEKEREEITRRIIKHLVDAGYFMRKDDYEKKYSIYEKGELFYGL